MSDRLTAIRAFVEVAKQQGFAPASRELGLSTSAISRHVMNMERWLNVELFHRTTRRLNLTDAGKSYLQRCIQILSEVDELERDAKALREDPVGELRISAPVFMGRHLLAPELPGFMSRFPKITIHLRLLDRMVNIVDEGYDLALRIGELDDSSLVARKLGDMRTLLCAAPDYLDQHGYPNAIQDLKNHNCLIDTVPQHGHRWPFIENKKKVRMPIKGNINVNDGELIREMALAGVGIAYLPDFFIREDITENRLATLLDESTGIKAGIFLVYPQTKHLSSTVRAFIDYVIEHSQLNSARANKSIRKSAPTG